MLKVNHHFNMAVIGKHYDKKILYYHKLFHSDLILRETLRNLTFEHQILYLQSFTLTVN